MRTTDAVHQVLAEAGGGPLHTTEIMRRAIHDIGWETTSPDPHHCIRAACTKSDAIERVGRKTYGIKKEILLSNSVEELDSDIEFTPDPDEIKNTSGRKIGRKMEQDDENINFEMTLIGNIIDVMSRNGDGVGNGAMKPREIGEIMLKEGMISDMKEMNYLNKRLLKYTMIFRRVRQGLYELGTDLRPVGSVRKALESLARRSFDQFRAGDINYMRLSWEDLPPIHLTGDKDGETTENLIAVFLHNDPKDMGTMKFIARNKGGKTSRNVSAIKVTNAFFKKLMSDPELYLDSSFDDLYNESGISTGTISNTGTDETTFRAERAEKPVQDAVVIPQEKEEVVPDVADSTNVVVDDVIGEIKAMRDISVKYDIPLEKVLELRESGLTLDIIERSIKVLCK